MSCNIAFFDQKKGVYERDFALPSLRIPLRVPKLYLGWYWSWNCDVQSSSCARVRTRAPSYQMERSQCMLSYNSTCRFNTGGDRNAACTIQGAGARGGFLNYIYENGFQLADMDILYIKMLEIASRSISFNKKNGCRPKI